MGLPIFQQLNIKVSGTWQKPTTLVSNEVLYENINKEWSYIYNLSSRYLECTFIWMMSQEEL